MAHENTPGFAPAHATDWSDRKLITCPCCKDPNLWSGDIAVAPVFRKPWLDHFVEAYGSPVCWGCADDHAECAFCAAIALSQTFDETEWGEIGCPDCVREAEIRAAEGREHERIESAMIHI